MLPEEIEKVIRAAELALRQHPIFALAPMYRRDIYVAIDANSTKGHLVRSWLGILAANRVASIWQDARPYDDLFTRIISVAEDVLSNLADASYARNIAVNAQKQIDEFGFVADSQGAIAVFFAGQSAVEALFEVLDRDPLKEIVIDGNTTDSDLDEWSSDTAAYAAAALAGPVWLPTSDPQRRYEFWKWWLDDAIPAAWQLSSNQPKQPPYHRGLPTKPS